MELITGIEIASVAFNLIYLILLIRENIWCWANGIIASILSIYLFIDAKLYSEAILYSFYVVVGFYGWMVWLGVWQSKKVLQIKSWPFKPHMLALIIGALGAVGLGKFFSNFTDAEQPYFDAFSTSFSFVASFLEAHKVLSAWLYWIILNLFSIWLYYSRNLSIYAGLMVVYSIASVWGFIEWRRKLEQQAKIAH